ncbi:MAG: helix-turn-helix transcriptional regulator [Rhodanobacteraceae bacterium]|nr:helix-turn-helix transcriptional regulator [Rhodanobacteraceae bacterium]
MSRFSVRQAAYAFYVTLIYIGGVVGFRLKDLPQFSAEPVEPVVPERAKAETDASFQRLQALMQREQLFTEPDLNLNDLAKRLGLTAPEASRVINEGAGKNFRAYVNDFRIESVKQKLTDANCAEVSILVIALESGFNSESSFYRVFKAATGVSPTAFRQRNY